MIQAISRISFPNGHSTERIFRWRGVDSNLCALMGAAVTRGGSFAVRQATPEEVASAARKPQGREVAP